MKYAFISRHKPTAEQVEIIQNDLQGELEHVGDMDGFNCTDQLRALRQVYSAVIVVHPGLALQAFDMGFIVGVFENGNRAPEGAPPSFTPVRVHLWSPVVVW